MRKIYRDIVSAILTSKYEKILLGKKDPKKGGVYSEAWHIPGGGIDDGESKIDALNREIVEETGIDISKYKAELVSDNETGISEKTLKSTGEKVLCEMKFFVYFVDLKLKANEIILKTSDDLVELKWFSKSKLKDINLNSPTQKLFTKLNLI